MPYPKPSERPEPPRVPWSRDNAWLADLFARHTGHHPGSRSLFANDIHRWVGDHGWQRVADVMSEVRRWAGGPLAPGAFKQRVDALLDAKRPTAKPSLPPVHEMASAQAIGVCVASRVRLGDGYFGLKGAALHPGQCGWCDYAVDVLVAWLDEFNDWRDTTAAGRNTESDWHRRDRTERAGLIGAAQSLSSEES